MAEYNKPLPDVNKFKEFWEGCKQHKLMVQRCKSCGTYQWYPRLMCGNCGSFDVEWSELKGQGKVYSYVIVHRPPMAAFKDDVPYTNVIVEMDDVPYIRMQARLIDCPPEEVKIGMPVESVFEDVTEEVTLPRFRRI